MSTLKTTFELIGIGRDIILRIRLSFFASKGIFLFVTHHFEQLFSLPDTLSMIN